MVRWVAAALNVALFANLVGCAPAPMSAGCDSCVRYGELSGEDLAELERFRWRNRSRWKRDVGIGGVTLGLAGMGLGAGYLVRADERDDDAARWYGSTLDSDRKRGDEIAAEASEFRTASVVGLSIGSALLVGGIILMITDAVEGPPDGVTTGAVAPPRLGVAFSGSQDGGVLGVLGSF